MTNFLRVFLGEDDVGLKAKKDPDGDYFKWPDGEDITVEITQPGSVLEITFSRTGDMRWRRVGTEGNRQH